MSTIEISADPSYLGSEATTDALNAAVAQAYEEYCLPADY